MSKLVAMGYIKSLSYTECGWIFLVWQENSFHYTKNNCSVDFYN